MNYDFLDEKNTTVISTKKIMNKESSIMLVSHDEEDGMWEFLDGDDVNEEDAMIVSLFEIVQIDETINQIADLPIGWIAYRENVFSKWVKQIN